MFFRKYSPMSKIGEGSFGDVHMVIDNLTNELLAAKIMKKKLGELSEESKIDIKREIGIISHISHPSVIEFVLYGVDNEKLVLITELGEKTLYDIFKINRTDQEKIGWNDTRKMISIYSLASVMSFLHSNNIVHRDLSPKNIIFDYDLNLKILDFGLSIVIEPNKQNSYKIGTPWYCPPEVIDQEYELSRKGDVYSFSILLYQIITNENPYTDKISRIQLFIEVMNGKRPMRRKSINDSWWKLLEECWQKEPQNRPSFAEILNRINNDPNLTLENVDVNEFNEAKKRIDNYQGIFDPNIDIELNQIIENKQRTVKRTLIDTDNIVAIYQKAKEMEKTKIKEAVQYYKKAADKGHIDASYKYGSMLMKGNDVSANKNNIEKSTNFLSKIKNFLGSFKKKKQNSV